MTGVAQRLRQCRVAAAGVLALAAATCLVPAPLVAAPALNLTYDAYFGGFSVMELHAVIALGADRAGPYSILIEGHTVGLVDRLSPVRFTTRSEGVSQSAGSLQPAHYENQTTKRSNKTKTVAIAFPQGRPPVTTFIPLPDDPIDPTPPALLQDIVDPASAIVAVIETVAATGSCSGTVAIFDGRRRYDIEFSQRNRETLAPSTFSMYSGPAQRCRARVSPRHGFDEGDRKSMPEDANVWFARVVPGAPLVPVRIDTDVSITALRIHLVAAALDGAPAGQAGAAGAAGNAQNSAGMPAPSAESARVP